jgi:uncharacterized protein (DUF4415 family)
MRSRDVRSVKLTPRQKARLDAMTDAEITAAAESDPDNPPLTEEEFARARLGRPPKAPEARKRSVTLRLPPEVIEQYKSTGRGWQTRMGEALRAGFPVLLRREGRAATSFKKASAPRVGKHAKRTTTKKASRKLARSRAKPRRHRAHG